MNQQYLSTVIWWGGEDEWKKSTKNRNAESKTERGDRMRRCAFDETYMDAFEEQHRKNKGPTFPKYVCSFHITVLIDHTVF
jgi:hypothetical protein